MGSEIMADESGTGKVERLLSMYKHLKPVPTAVAHPCEASALSGAIEAAHQDSLCPSWSARAQRSRPPAKSAQVTVSQGEFRGH
jgi:hypothetical protein